MKAGPDAAKEISVTQEVGSVAGGEVTGFKAGTVGGDVSVKSTINQIIQGDYVDCRQITISLQNDPHALNELVERLAERLGANRQTLIRAASPPERVSQQIKEIEAAQKQLAAQGVPLTAGAAHRLGMLAAYRRDYETALDYFRQATQIDPKYMDAYEAIAWLQQSQAHHDLVYGDYAQAAARLAEARAAVMSTDPLDAQMLALRGYIAGTSAQVADATGNQAERDRYHAEAVKLFERAAELDPKNPSAQNGLGNAYHHANNLDAAIAAHRRAIKLEPRYVAAYHDLAIVCESKMHAAPSRAKYWCREALKAWRMAYKLAPEDSGFAADDIVRIGKHILDLEQQCGKSK